MDINKVKELAKEYDVLITKQFLEFALKFDDEKLVKDFLHYWRKERGVGGGDLVSYFTQYYKKGDK